MAQITEHALQGGPALREITLHDGDVSLSLLNYGATTRNWQVPVQGGQIPVILGFENPADYLTSPYFIGAIAGRVSNRIGQARYRYNDTEHVLDANEGANTLHGGARGLHTQFWDMELDGARAVVLRYVSPDGENGFPGRAEITLRVQLNGARVRYEFTAHVDRPTPISLAQHNYYNLMGSGDIWDHHFQCDADQVLIKDQANVCTGEMADVTGSACDFRTGQTFGAASPDRQVTDGHLVFNADRDRADSVVQVTAPNGVQMRIWSDQLGAQLYTPAQMPVLQGGLKGQTYSTAAGFCFEPQGFPNALNVPEFPSMMVHPDQPYVQNLEIEISV